MYLNFKNSQNKSPKINHTHTYIATLTHIAYTPHSYPPLTPPAHLPAHTPRSHLPLTPPAHTPLLTPPAHTQVVLYDMALQFTRTLYLRTKNTVYCTLRSELIMALHDKEVPPTPPHPANYYPVYTNLIIIIIFIY